MLIFAWEANSTRPSQAQTGQPFSITLAEIGYGDKSLQGPTAQTRYFFGLPTYWELQPDNYFDLRVNYTLSGQEEYAPTLLDVELNGNIIQTIEFETPGARQIQVALPLEMLRPPEDTRLNQLQLKLSVHARCEQAQLTSLTISDASTFHFMYSEKPIALDLAHLPTTLYQAYAFEPTQARLILPTQPTGPDVRAAIMTAAWLGEQSGDQLPLFASLAPETGRPAFESQHLIILGQPENNPLLRQLSLPLPLRQRQLDLRSQMPASVAPGQVFSYTLSVENTSTFSQNLTVQDQLPQNTTFLACTGACQESAPGLLTWEIGQVDAAAQVSTVVNLRLALFPIDEKIEKIEHTASLFDWRGQIINIDTLTASVSMTNTDRMIASPQDKTLYFFTHDNQGIAEGDGLIQLLNSPWDPHQVIVVVTGLSDKALLKAARALSTQSDLLQMSGIFAIVQAVQPPAKTVDRAVTDTSLAGLGYQDVTLENATLDTMPYYFDLPGTSTLGPDSYVALHFAHGVALSKLSATLDLQLNRVPIGSIELDEQNASGRWVTFDLPTTPAIPGRNTLEVKVGFRQDGVCVDLRNSHLWLSIYKDSLLHLSHQEIPLILKLDSFPYPFSDVSNLSDVVFLLSPQPDTDVLEGTLRLASRLGNISNGDRFEPKVVMDENPDPYTWKGHDLIAIGRPTRNPFVAAVNERLPQPFRPGTDEIRQQIDDVIFRLPPDINLGYIQELLSPWDEHQAMLVVTGSTDQGVTWALNAMTDPQLRWRLEGNLALVRKEEIQTIDTREQSALQITPIFTPGLTPQATATPTPSPTPTATTTAIAQTPVPTRIATTTTAITATAATTDATTSQTPSPSVTPTSGPVATRRIRRSTPAWLLPLLIAGLATTVVGVLITFLRRKT